MRAVRYTFLTFILWMLAILPAWSQGTVSLSGTVTDATGGVVPGVAVTLTNEATQAIRTTITGDSGEYTFPQLPPGTYTAEFALSGFKTAIRNKVNLPIGTQQVLNVELEVGQISDQIVVEGGVTAVNTIDASVGNPFDEVQVRQLPLEARNPSQLLSLQAGVVWAGESLGDDRGGSVFGGRSNQGNITLDGADVNDQVTQNAMQSVLPIPLDSVQEFRVTTTNSGAQHGRSSGAQIELVTKGGGNDWHGSAYWFNRNSVFASNGFFENRLGIDKAPLNRNIFGASVGGPLIKDRAFFFVNWESRRDATATPATRVVPTDTFKDGVLMYQCNDPAQCPGGAVQGLTQTHNIPAGWYGLTPAQTASTIDPCGSTPCTDVLGKAVTPGVNPAIISLMQGYPTGNDPSSGSNAGLDDGFNAIGYRFTPAIAVNNNDYVARFDFNLDSNGQHQMFWRGSLADDKRVNTPEQFPNDPLTGNPNDPTANRLNNSKGMAVSYNYNIRPNLINTVRYGLTRQGIDNGGTLGTSYSTRGFSSVRNFTRPNVRIVPAHMVTDDLTWVRGKHTWQFGFAGRHISNQRSTFGQSFDSFNSNNGWMPGLGRNCVMPGNSADTCPNGPLINALPRIAGGHQSPFARLTVDMLGLISSNGATYLFDPAGNAQPFGTPKFRQFNTSEFELYVQDTWRLRSDLTLTLGLRYSYSTVPFETSGYQVIPSVDMEQWFDQRMTNMEQGIPSDASPLITFNPGGPANNAPDYFKTDKNNFAPRLAVAYSPGFDGGVGRFLFGDSGKSSIRAGFNINYDRMAGQLANVLDDDGAVGLSSQGRVAYGRFDYFAFRGKETGTRFTGFDNFPPTGEPFFTPPGGGLPQTPPPNTDEYGTAIIPNLRTPYSIQFNFSIERELAKGMVLNIGYVGRWGRNLLLLGDYSQPLRFRDPDSGMDIWEAFTELESRMNTSDLSYDGPCLQDPNSCAPIPFFENVYSGMAEYWGGVEGKTFASNTAAMADFSRTWAPGWADLTKDLDVYTPVYGGMSVYNPKYDPEGDGRVLWPQQYTLLSVRNNSAKSFYNSMVLSVRRRMGGLFFDANYVFSKSIDDGSALENSGYGGVDPNNFEPYTQRAVSDFDIKHNFNANWVWDFPVGRGRSFGAGIPGWADQIVGGWQISGVWRWRSGFPLDVANGFYFPTTWDISGNAVLLSPLKSDLQKHAPDGPNLFANPVDTSVSNPFHATGTAYAAHTHTMMGGSGSRSTLRGPRFFTVDLGFGKSFRMPFEGHRLQLRWEIFNAFNTVNFSSNGASLNLDNVGSFGRFSSTASSASQSFPLVPHNRVMQIGLRYEF